MVQEGNIKGLIWYSEGYHSGTEDDYDAFLQSNENAKLIFTFNEIKPSQLHKLAENLNRSNARDLNID